MTRTFTIGRAKRTDIQLRGSSVSRVHAELRLGKGGAIRLVDCGSSNGTFVFHDGKWTPVSKARVTLASRVRFGSVERRMQDLVELCAKRAESAAGDGSDDRASPKGGAAARRDDRQHFERPRRNPNTGEIEEGA